jgi:OmpA-OmpF porin, OOP family
MVGQTGFSDPYLSIGLGYTQANNQGRCTYDVFVGFRTRFSDCFGLDFNSSWKWRMIKDATITCNMLLAWSISLV